jgi:hypothetical protein
MTWEGPVDQFIDIDVDTIVLTNLNCAFELLNDYKVLAATANNPEGISLCGKQEPVHLLSCEQIGFSANTGFLVSKWHSLRLLSAAQNLHKMEHYTQYLRLSTYRHHFGNNIVIGDAHR